MAGSQPLDDGADIGGALPQLGEGSGLSSSNGPSRSSHQPGWGRGTRSRRRVAPRCESQTVGASVTPPAARDQATTACSFRL